MAQPLALFAQRLLAPGSKPWSPRRAHQLGRRVSRQRRPRLSSSCRCRATARSRRRSCLTAAAELLVAAVGVEQSSWYDGAQAGAARTGRTCDQALGATARSRARGAAQGIRPRRPSRRRGARARGRARPRGRARRGRRDPRPRRSPPARRAPPRRMLRRQPRRSRRVASAPSRRPIACARIVFPAPVSPVIAVRPAAGVSSPSRTRTRFSMRRLRSKGPAVAGEEGHFGQRGEPRSCSPMRASARAPGGARRRRARRRVRSPAHPACGSRRAGRVRAGRRVAGR